VKFQAADIRKMDIGRCHARRVLLAQSLLPGIVDTDVYRASDPTAPGDEDRTGQETHRSHHGIDVSYATVTVRIGLRGGNGAVEQRTGRVAFYNPQANFGFIEPDDGSADVVFSIRPGAEPLEVGDSVAYDLAPDSSVTPMGPQALRLRRVGFAVSRSETERDPATV
jgi:cold shock CspA family protein